MKHSKRNPSNVPELLLERYRLGEVTPDEMEWLRQRLDADETLGARIRALGDTDKATRQQYPSRWLAAQIRRRLRSSIANLSTSAGPRGRGWRIRIAVAVAAMVMLGAGLRLLGPLPLPSWMASPGAEPADRLKGGSLVLFRKTVDGSEVLGEGARARGGDQLRIGYRATGRRFGLILSIDGRGVVTRHLPKRGDRAAQLNQEGLVLLDYAYELDDAPGWECFYLIAGRQEFNVAPVLEAARTLGARAGAGASLPGALNLDAALEQTSLVLIKEAIR